MACNSLPASIHGLSNTSSTNYDRIIVANAPELIFFVIPDDRGKLFVGNPPVSNSKELSDLFSEFGLVYEATFYPAGYTSTKTSQNPENVSTAKNPYGFVTFYSVSAATSALKEAKKKYGKHMFVHFVTQRNSDLEMQRPKRVLQLHRCIELLNYYIGPSHWCSKFVDGMSPVSPEECDAEAREMAEKDFKQKFPNGPPKGKAVVSYAYDTRVELSLGDGRYSIGEGTGMAIGVDDKEAVNMAKKLASSRAQKAAFSKIVIVNLNGKTGVRVLATCPVSDLTLTEEELAEMKTGSNDPDVKEELVSQVR